MDANQGPSSGGTNKKKGTVRCLVHTLTDPLLSLAEGDPLELAEEAACEEQARGVLPEPVPDLPGVRRQPAEARAVWLSQPGHSGEHPGKRPVSHTLTSLSSILVSV